MNGCWWARDRTPQQIRDILSNSSLWIAALTSEREGATVVGFCRILTDWVARAFLEDVMVAESARGKKIGSRLLAAVKAHKRLQGVEQVALDTNNTLAKAFYAPAGWEIEALDASPNGSAHAKYYPAGAHPAWHAFHPT